ncbi:hypothetical protein [Burkholderia multivorans]|uniref:hypothetical protein n=1 Tax=Burkholderia multivorans TaxID=87883 RepID=UPI0011B27AD3|nr:hypothetical protein [Burkholderia multivorans]MBU9283727.1 hypothetical protein [Burkholderia multivorans]MDN7446649.1 hypothetical protein [Burkholderia multivorans]
MSKFPTPNDNLIQRATRAHRIFVSKNGGVADIPSNSTSGVCGHAGREYVVLRNVRGIMAIYRIRSDTGVLRRLKRWSAALVN